MPLLLATSYCSDCPHNVTMFPVQWDVVNSLLLEKISVIVWDLECHSFLTLFQFYSEGVRKFSGNGPHNPFRSQTHNSVSILFQSHHIGTPKCLTTFCRNGLVSVDDNNYYYSFLLQEWTTVRRTKKQNIHIYVGESCLLECDAM